MNGDQLPTKMHFVHPNLCCATTIKFCNIQCVHQHDCVNVCMHVYVVCVRVLFWLVCVVLSVLPHDCCKHSELLLVVYQVLRYSVWGKSIIGIEWGLFMSEYCYSTIKLSVLSMPLCPVCVCVIFLPLCTGAHSTTHLLQSFRVPIHVCVAKQKTFGYMYTMGMFTVPWGKLVLLIVLLFNCKFSISEVTFQASRNSNFLWYIEA